MKVNVAHVANGQIAGMGDLVSLLTGGEGSSFASLLGSSESEPDSAVRADGGRGRQRNRSNEKQSDEEDRPPVPQNSSPSATSVPIAPQILPGIATPPWQHEFRDRGASEDVGRMPVSSALAEVAGESGRTVRRPATEANARTIGEIASNPQLAPVLGTAEAAPALDLNGAGQLRSPKSDDFRSEDTEVRKATSSSNNNDSPLRVERPASVTSGIVQSLATLVDNSTPAPITQTETHLHLLGFSKAGKYVTPSRGVASADGIQNPAPSPGGRPGDPSEDGKGDASSSERSQGIVSSASSSPTVAGGHSQSNAHDTHRGSSDAKQTDTDTRPSVPQALGSGALAASGSVHGHSTSANSNRPDSDRESIPNSQIKAQTLPQAGDANVARLLGGAMHGDLRVGVHTEAFGRVTIQTSAQSGQLSAQLSLENAKESATLAAHLPGVEQKIVQQHGLTASVRLVGGFGGGAGAGSMGRDQSGPGRRDSEPHAALGSGQIQLHSTNEPRGVGAALIGSRHLSSSRLDVTV